MKVGEVLFLSPGPPMAPPIDPLFLMLNLLVALWCGLGILLGILAVMTNRGSGAVLVISSSLLLLTLGATVGATESALLPVAIFLPLLLAVAACEPPEPSTLDAPPFANVPPEALEKFPAHQGPSAPGIFRPLDSVISPPHLQPPP
jgi:hypothetical protein